MGCAFLKPTTRFIVSITFRELRETAQIVSALGNPPPWTLAIRAATGLGGSGFDRHTSR